MPDGASLVAYTAGRAVLRRPAAWPVFLWLVALASLLPFAAVPFSQHVVGDQAASADLILVLAFLGNNFHVATTGWFYTDEAIRPHFVEHKRRYLIVPALLIAGTALVFQLATPILRSAILAGFFAWQLWHFQKQNIGLLSFVAAGSGRVPVSPWERRTLMLASLPGILGFFSLMPVGLSQFSVQLAWLHHVGGILYMPVAIAAIVAVTKVPALRTNRLRLAAFAFGTLFFVPTFLFRDQLSAISSYAIAHGLQYIVFMGYVAAGRRPMLPSLVMLLGLGTLGAVLLNGAVVAPDIKDFPYGFAVYGAFLGVVMSHFVLDAGIWRLREPFQRTYMRGRFAFVFDRRS